MSASEIPLVTNDNYESSYLRTVTGEVIPRYTKRYRENFKIDPDGVYVRSDPTRNWNLNNGVLEAIDNLIPY
jgi:hypothetical protein